MAANPETGSRGPDPNGPGFEADDADHYELLGVPFTATHAEITHAYRRAMKQAHPDRKRPEQRAAAELLARQLNAAYAVLSDPIKRQAYDRTIRQQVIQDQIMRRYVGGFQTFDDTPGPGRAHLRRQPTEAERRERVAADRQASLTLVIVGVVVMLVFVLGLIALSLFGSAFEAVR